MPLRNFDFNLLKALDALHEKLEKHGLGGGTCFTTAVGGFRPSMLHIYNLGTIYSNCS